MKINPIKIILWLTYHYSSFLIKILLIIHLDTFLAAKEYETISQILFWIFSVDHWRGYAFDVLITDSICDGYLGIGALWLMTGEAQCVDLDLLTFDQSRRTLDSEFKERWLGGDGLFKSLAS